MERALRHIIGVFATSLVLLTTSGVSVAGPYAPAAGETGSTAVAHDDSRFVSWATGATVDYSGALALPDEQWRDASMALGPAKSILDGAYFDIVSLGRGGEIILDFETPIVDGDGRMWICEMVGYMPDIDGTGEDVPQGRIVILEDSDNDGKVDKRTVVLDKLLLPRSIYLLDDGILWADQSSLYFQGRDGDKPKGKDT